MTALSPVLNRGRWENEDHLGQQVPKVNLETWVEMESPVYLELVYVHYLN